MPPRSETADAPRAEFVCLPKCELVPVPPGLDPAGVPFNALLPHAAVLVPEQCTNLRIWRRFFSEDVKKNHLETLEMLF